MPVRFAEDTSELRYATLLFDIGDQLKQRGSSRTMQYLGTSVSDYWERMGWESAAADDETVSLWTVELFPLATTITESMQIAVAIYAASCKTTQNGRRLYSAQQIMANCDIDAMISWRKGCIFGNIKRSD